MIAFHKSPPQLPLLPIRNRCSISLLETDLLRENLLHHTLFVHFQLLLLLLQQLNTLIHRRQEGGYFFLFGERGEADNSI